MGKGQSSLFAVTPASLCIVEAKLTKRVRLGIGSKLAMQISIYLEVSLRDKQPRPFFLIELKYRPSIAEMCLQSVFEPESPFPETRTLPAELPILAEL